MIPKKVIYTDGHAVTVTESTFHVKNADYNLNGIIKHGLYVLRPSKLPSVILVLLGLVFVALGFAQIIPSTMIRDAYIGNTLVHGNTIAMVVGGVIAIIGVLSIGLLRDRYAVRISTAEGEKNVIVSRHKAYIAQIVDALSASHYVIRPELL